MFLSFDIKPAWCFSDCLFVCLSYVNCTMALKRKSTLSWNPLHSRVYFSSPFDTTPSLIQFHDEKAKSDFLENFSQQGIHSKCQVNLSDFSDTDLSTIIYSRGWESLCGIPVMYPSVIIQEFYFNMHGFDYSIPQFVTCVRGIHMVVTLDIVSEVLHVPRVVHLDYPSGEHLRTVSKDELASLFCETLSSWGERQNTPCSAFAKGPRFLNIVITSILHPLSHYNTITEPRACFCYPSSRIFLLTFILTLYSPL